MGLSPSQYRKTDEYKRLYNKFKDDPILFGRSMFPDMTTLPTPDFHHDLADLYKDDDADQVCIVAPRDHAKSSIVAELFTMHHITFDEGDKLILIVSKTQGKAKDRLETIKDMLESEKFKYMFGHKVGGVDYSSKWNEQEVQVTKEYVNRFGEKKENTWTIICKGMTQHIRGIKKGHRRVSYLVLDDPENEENTKTAEAMENNYEKLLQGLAPAVERDGQAWVIGTPLHQRCMVFRLKHRLDWEYRHYSAEMDPENEVSLWPERYSWDDLMKKREAAEKDNPPKLSSYVQEYCCKIIPDTKRLFQEEEINWYEGNITFIGKNPVLEYHVVDRYGDKVGDDKRVPVDIYTGIDVATSTKDTADYFVIFHIAVDPDNNRFVLPYYRDRVKPSQAIDRVVSEYKKFRSRRVSIETSAQQNIMRDVLRDRDDIHIPGLSVDHDPQDKKEKRHLELLEPWISAGKVYMQRDQVTLKDEMLMHPKGDTDDLLDGMYYAFLHAKPPKRQSLNDNSSISGTGHKTRGRQSWMTA